jgi:hypothetical protein
MTSTVPATVVAMVVLSLAGLLPILALVGLRWVTVPLLPLAGAVLAALAATCFMAVGGSLLGWFVALAVVVALAVAGSWARRPDWRPWRQVSDRTPSPGSGSWYRLAGAAGALVILLACLWCLRGLATPTVGFDARALWIMRAGWFLQSQHQLLIDMRLPDLKLGQTSYPPLASASVAVAWQATGTHTVRLGVVVIAVLNTCALSVAAFALVQCGRTCTRRFLSRADAMIERTNSQGERLARVGVALSPTVIGIVAAALVVFVAFGITEPFMTNGYADPIWSLAAVGALVYGLQLENARVHQGVALVLILVAGMSKDEGVATATILILLMAARVVAAMNAEERHRRWWRPVLVALAALAAVGAWPVLLRVLHVREESTAQSPIHAMPGRARIAFDGLAPYLHVIVLAAPVAIVGGLVLSRVRRRSGLANDWWAWGGLAGGVAVVSGAYVIGTVPVQDWLVGTADRVSEFPDLTAWWIVAVWAIVASGVPAQRSPTVTPMEDHAPLPTLVIAE